MLKAPSIEEIELLVEEVRVSCEKVFKGKKKDPKLCIELLKDKLVSTYMFCVVTPVTGFIKVRIKNSEFWALHHGTEVWIEGENFYLDVCLDEYNAYGCYFPETWVSLKSPLLSLKISKNDLFIHGRTGLTVSYT